MRESFVSFVLTNMPMLYPLLKKFFEIIGSSIMLTSVHGESRRAASKGNAYRLGSYPDGGHTKRKVNDPDPLPDETPFGSDEHIVPARVEGSRAASSSQDTPRVGEHIDDEYLAGNPFQQGHNHVHVFPGPVHKHHRSQTSAPALGGILVTKDFVVTEQYQADGASRGGEAYLDV